MNSDAGDQGGKGRRRKSSGADDEPTPAPAPAEPEAKRSDDDAPDPMELAIRLAKRSAKSGGGPFGAVIVRDGAIVCSGANAVVSSGDPTAHAEMVAIREAARVLGTFDLSDCELFSSCEPCPMCMGAIYWARIKRVWYACDRDDAAAVGFDDAFMYEELERKPSKRKIPMRRVLRKKGLKAFQIWLANPERRTY